MPFSSYIIATTYLKLLLNQPELVSMLDKHTKGAYLSWFDDDYVHSAEIQPVFEAFSDAGLDSWIMKFGERIDSTTHGPLGFTVLSAPDLRTALNALCEYSCIRTTAYSSELKESDNRLSIVSIDQTGSELVARWLLEAGMKVVQRLIEHLTAHPLKDNALIRFSHPRPNYANKLEAYFGIPCEFNASENSFSIPASWGDIPSPLSDSGAYRTNLAKCKEIKQSLKQHNDVLTLTKNRLEVFFNDCVSCDQKPSALPSLDTLANELALSPRTLARRLEAQHSSYKSELNAARKQQANHLLLDTHMRIADIAYYLSYQESASFVRAFKKWFKVTPTQYRRASLIHDNNKRQI